MAKIVVECTDCTLKFEAALPWAKFMKRCGDCKAAAKRESVKQSRIRRRIKEGKPPKPKKPKKIIKKREPAEKPAGWFDPKKVNPIPEGWYNINFETEEECNKFWETLWDKSFPNRPLKNEPNNW